MNSEYRERQRGALLWQTQDWVLGVIKYGGF